MLVGQDLQGSQWSFRPSNLLAESKDDWGDSATGRRPDPTPSLNLFGARSYPKDPLKSLFDPSWYFRKVLRSPGDADFPGFSLCGIRKFADSLCIPFMMFDKAEMLCRRKRN